MTTAFAIGVLVLAAACAVGFVWWMFSGAAAWIEPDERPGQAGGADEGEGDEGERPDGKSHDGKSHDGKRHEHEGEGHDD